MPSQNKFKTYDDKIISTNKDLDEVKISCNLMINSFSSKILYEEICQEN